MSAHSNRKILAWLRCQGVIIDINQDSLKQKTKNSSVWFKEVFGTWSNDTDWLLTLNRVLWKWSRLIWTQLPICWWTRQKEKIKEREASDSFFVRSHCTVAAVVAVATVVVVIVVVDVVVIVIVVVAVVIVIAVVVVVVVAAATTETELFYLPDIWKACN